MRRPGNQAPAFSQAEVTRPKPKPIPCEHDLARDGRRDHGICAFYFPQAETEWDKVCGCAFLGNFYPASVRLRIKGTAYDFRNAEAAFQALKYPESADRFEHCDGAAAFRLRSALGDRADRTYSGHGSNWKAMRAVLNAKFQDKTLGDALVATGDAFLLEHNACIGRDEFWSDNGDGSGRNMLGLQLMLLREKLRAAAHQGPGRWAWLQGHVDSEGLLANAEGEWQRAVKAATATILKRFPLSGTVAMARAQPSEVSPSHRPREASLGPSRGAAAREPSVQRALHGAQMQPREATMTTSPTVPSAIPVEASSSGWRPSLEATSKGSYATQASADTVVQSPSAERAAPAAPTTGASSGSTAGPISSGPAGYDLSSLNYKTQGPMSTYQSDFNGTPFKSQGPMSTYQLDFNARKFVKHEPLSLG